MVGGAVWSSGDRECAEVETLLDPLGMAMTNYASFKHLSGNGTLPDRFDPSL